MQTAVLMVMDSRACAPSRAMQDPQSRSSSLTGAVTRSDRKNNSGWIDREEERGFEHQDEAAEPHPSMRQH